MICFIVLKDNNEKLLPRFEGTLTVMAAKMPQ